ncbi:MAG: reductase [Lactobacillus sp.]|nr:reductase [Lactobacillus sp.]
MIIPYKRDYQKTAMGLLSYLDEFHHFKNITEEIALCESADDYELLFYAVNHNKIGIIGIRSSEHFATIRYVALAPGFRDAAYYRNLMSELKAYYPKKHLTTVPEMTSLMEYLKDERD